MKKNGEWGASFDRPAGTTYACAASVFTMRRGGAGPGCFLIVVPCRGGRVMEVGVLLGVMGVLTVVSVYFWVVRAKPGESPQK
jgi:hypothetical protein